MRLRSLSRSRMSRPRRAISPKVICGTAATSCSAPACCSMSIAASMRPASTPSAMRLRKQAAISPSSRSMKSFSARAPHLHRLRRDGKDQNGRRHPRQLWLVGCRIVAFGVGVVRQGRGRQHRARLHRSFRTPATITYPPIVRWWRCRASRILWWSPRRTLFWWRARTTPPA